MLRKHGGCLSRNDDVMEDDKAEGYCRLEPMNSTDNDGGAERDSYENDYFKPRDSYQMNSPEAMPRKKNRDRYTEIDIKGKRLSTKLRRKELRKQIGHVLHSTWKWFKRGLLAVTPSLASMFMLVPFPTHTMVSAAARHQAAKDLKGTSVYI